MLKLFKSNYGLELTRSFRDIEMLYTHIYYNSLIRSITKFWQSWIRIKLQNQHKQQSSTLKDLFQVRMRSRFITRMERSRKKYTEGWTLQH